MKRLMLLLTASLLVCVTAQSADFKWRSHPVDGSLTGVTVPSTDNIPEALGKVDSKGRYTAPNGTVFKANSATAKAAALMLDAQAPMAEVKEVIGFCPAGMAKHRPQSELSNWFVDFLMARVAKETGRQVDVSFYNFGGIRTNMPQGKVTVDDIMSMFPFKNYLCYVSLKGSDLRAIYQWLARTGMQAIGGAKVVIKGNTLESVTIGGEPLDDKKVYGVATINFLLNGGDGFNIARNAQEVVMTDLMVKDAVIPYLRRLLAESQSIEYSIDDRVTFIKDDDQ